MNEVIKAIFDRRSIRAYTADPVTPEQTELLRRAAAASPTAINAQNWHFSFVTDSSIISEVENAVADKIIANGDAGAVERLKSRSGKIFYNAPLVIFISADRTKRWCDVDAGIAVQNLALAAHSMGLGSVIIGMADMALSAERSEEFAKKLDFPEGFTFAIAISIGTPAASKEPHPEAEDRFSFI